MPLERLFREAFQVCPVCGGELVEKRVEKILKGGTDTVSVEVDALVCLQCGERLYPENVVRRFEHLRGKLAHGETDDLSVVGRAYQVRETG